MKQNTTIILMVCVGILILGSALFLFPPSIAAAGPTIDPDGNPTEDLAGAGLEFFAVTSDGEEFQIPQANVFAGSVWIEGVAVENVYARVKVSYDISGYKVDTEHPLTVRAIVRIADWFAEDPNNEYYAMQMASNNDPFYDPDDLLEVVAASWETTTLLEAQTDFILGKIYLAPEAGEVSLFLAGDINDAVMLLWNWIHSGDSVVGKTLSVLFEARVRIGGYYETPEGWQSDLIWSDWSLRYRLKMGLSSTAGVTGTISVTIGSFSVSGGTQDMSLPLTFMIIGGGGIFVVFVAMPFIDKMGWG